MIAGFEVPDSGRVVIDGVDVTAAPPYARPVNMMFQSYALFPHLTVAENILFGLRVRKVPAGERVRRLNRVAALLGLGPLLGRKPSQLSGGQQQRVALGRAIIAETPVCLMDEPLSNLDAQLRAEMRREIRTLQQKLGITMVYVTHDQTEAMSMADRVILMREGKIEQAADPDHLYARPASTFAARFIGTPPMNILTLDTRPSGTFLAGSNAPILAGQVEGAQIGIRPEDIVIDEKGIAARIVNVEYMGADTVLACTVGDQPITARVPGKTALASGSVIRLGWRPDAVHFFDAVSGKRRNDLTTNVLLEGPGPIRNVLV
jgi:sn-glycerol 3-phosphate transport system ATP-binding protein